VRRFALALIFVLIVPASARAWTWPVDGPVVRGFSFDPDHPYAGGQHRGIDIGASSGTAVRAPSAGTVTFAGTVPNSGKTISIETPSGYTATLLHLGSIAVSRNAHVDEGAVVATSGTGSFVYFGLRSTPNPQGYVDPLAFLPVRTDVTPQTGGTATASQQAVDPAHGADAVTAAVTTGAAAAPAAQPAAPAARTPSANDVSSTRGTTHEGAAPAQSSAPRASAPAVPTNSPAVGAHSSAATGAQGSGSGADPSTAEDGSADDERPLTISTPAAAGGEPGLRPVVGRSSTPAVEAVPATTRRRVVRKGDARPTAHAADAERVTSAAHELPPVAVGERKQAATSTSRDASAGQALLPPLIAAIVASLALAAAFALRRRLRKRQVTARIMSVPGRSSEQEPISVRAATRQEDSRGARMAVRERSSPPRSRGGVRGAGGHLRAVPPLEGERRADGEWDGRTRHAGDGRGRQGGRLAA
jgi:hypothetical protein